MDALTPYKTRRRATDGYGLTIDHSGSGVQPGFKALENGIIVPITFDEQLDTFKSFPDTAMFSHMMRRNPPLHEEALIEIWEDENFTFWKTIKNPSSIISDEEPAKALRILDEMRTRDTDVSAALVDRDLAVASLDWDVIPRDKDQSQLVEMAELFKGDLEDIDLAALVGSFTYDLYYGFGMREIPWFWKNADHWAFQNLEPVNQWAWTFEKITRQPRLLPNEEDQSGFGIPVSPGRFLYTVRRDPVNGKNPYGFADGLDVYYPARWRNWTIKALLSAAAKIGGTVAIGQYPRGASPDQQTALLDATEAIQNNQAIILPDDQSIDLPEMGRVSIKDFLTAVDDLFARMIKRRLTGAEFATGRGAASPTGTLAETKEHAKVSDAWKEGAAKYVMGAVDQLARLWTDFNFGHDTPHPKFTLDFEGKENAKLLTENIDTLSTIIELKKEEVYKKTGWTQPAPGDEIIQVRQPAQFRNPFNNMLPTDNAPPVVAQRAVPGDISQSATGKTSDNNPDSIDEAKQKQEFHDHGLPDHIGEVSPELFQETQKLAKQWEREQEILTGKILADAQVNPDSYPVFMNELEEDLAAPGLETYDDARKAIGISAASRETFRDYMKGAQASTFTLHTVQQLDKFTDDMAANFDETDAALILIKIKLSGGNKSIFQDAEPVEFMPFERAMEILRLRAPNLSPQYYDLVEQDLHGWATTVSGLESVATVEAVINSLNKAEAAGQSFAQWRNEIDDILSTEDIEKLRPGQLETVFRTNLQTAYNAAGERLVNEVDPAGDIYPAYEFLNGDPVSTICIPRDGKVFPRSDKSNIPPLHFNCKSYIIWLSKFDEFSTAPQLTRDSLPPPDKGFDRSPNQLLGRGIS